MENNIKLTTYKCPADGTVWSGNNVPTSCSTCGLDSAHCPVVDESATTASADLGSADAVVPGAEQSPVSPDAPATPSSTAPGVGTPDNTTAASPDTTTPPAPETE